ncbi:hypothetical protein FHX06_000397 [Rhizobium sp. BK512]|uniref:DUF6959 family protein n=1 Tax=Rhizobium sp. BK512 TaxID=2587010 RepID=UPI000DDDA7E7|nr:hypothetical protein [Rhizobium sp. BK512]MBB3559100.1 hypothetical protein [Rhizobium sp. BK512]
MRSENVEILSDKTNAAIMRHPDRAFPGVLVQGDNLYAMCWKADLICNEVGRAAPGYKKLNELRNTLWAYLNHYKVTLIEHGHKLPFDDAQSADAFTPEIRPCDNHR